MRRAALAALPALGLSASMALAGCPAGSTMLVSCTMKSGAKQLDTCLIGDEALYRFGPKGAAPELELRHSVRDVDFTPWPGVSRTIWEGFTFFNNGVGYEVYHAIERAPEEENPELRGGITVLQGEETLATLTCDPGSVQSAGYGLPLFEAKEAAGQCWSRDSFAWKDC